MKCRYCNEPIEHVTNRSGYTGWRHAAWGFIYCVTRRFGEHPAEPRTY